MAHLSLAFLGPLQVTLDGRPVRAAAYDKVWALLAYLALSPGESYSRDTLLALLWPNQPEAAARTSLRQALARLRQAIGDHSAQPPFLLVDRETLQFNPASNYQLDVAEFMALDAACHAHRHRRRETCLPCAQRRERAAALYRGRFLDHFFLPDSAAFEEWALLNRERLHQRALAGLGQLADYHERRGDYEQARRCAERQLALDPWREEAHRQLMRLLVLTGQRSEALVQYERCRAVLAAELGIEPAEETTAYYQRIRAAEFDGLLAADLLRPPAAARHNLPPQPTPFVGRETELAALDELLANPACRLITLAGPGGIGKTRLAIQAAAEQSVAFTQGAVFVPLAPLSSANLIAPAIAAALGLSLFGKEPPAAQLLRYLRDQEILLILDNFEHLLDGAALLLAILQQTAGVTLLITSREPLKLRAEWVFDVEGLPVPAADDLGEMQSFDAVTLFLQRARQAVTSFEVAGADAPFVARICQLVAGMPLGIELAATWVRALSCPEIARAIEQDLDVLASELRDVPDRHRSLRAVFNHSWALLSADEQAILGRLAVFRTGFTGAAAAEVAGATPAHLRALVDKSLLRRGLDERYELHELVRQFAAERLRAAEAEEETPARHLAYYLTLAEETEPKLRRPGQAIWLNRLSREDDNFRAALEWALETDEAESALRLAGALRWYWDLKNYNLEARRWLAAALDLKASQGPLARSAWRAKALLGVFPVGEETPDLRAARQSRLEESLSIYRELGDKVGMAEALGWLGMLRPLPSDAVAKFRLFQESLDLSLAAGDRRGVGACLFWMGWAFEDLGNRAKALDYMRRSADIMREVGDQWFLINILNQLAWQTWLDGDAVHARALFEEHLAIPESRGGGFHWGALRYLFEISLAQGCYPLAREEALAMPATSGQQRELAAVEVRLGQIDYLQGRLDEARAHFEAGLKQFRELQEPNGMGWTPPWLGCVAYRLGDLQQARALINEGLAIHDPDGYWLELAFALLSLGDVTRAQGETAASAQLYTRGLKMVVAHGARPDVAKYLEAFAKLALLAAQPGRATRLLGAAQALREQIGTPVPPVERAEHDQAVAETRAQLDPTAFSTAWDEGLGLSWDQAAAYALET